MLTCRYEIQAYFRSIYRSCSAANAVESRSFTTGLFTETKLFRLFWFYKISDVCYKTQRNILLPDDLKKKIYQSSTSADTETMKNKAKPIKEEVRNRNTFRTKALIASLISLIYSFQD